CAASGRGLLDVALTFAAVACKLFFQRRRDLFHKVNTATRPFPFTESSTYIRPSLPTQIAPGECSEPTTSGAPESPPMLHKKSPVFGSTACTRSFPGVVTKRRPARSKASPSGVENWMLTKPSNV